MILGLDHIAIIASSEASIDFYKRLEFEETERIERGYDTIVFMEGHGFNLEVFVDPNHPKRVDRPEAMGLRHLALKVKNINGVLDKFDCEPVRKDWHGENFTFTKDPDGLPIELHE